jgi:hypothetical protein
LHLRNGGTIVLNGTNSIKSTFNDSNTEDSVGIQTDYNLIIQGAGSLTATSGTAQHTYGIGVGENFTIENGARVIANGGNAKNDSVGIRAWDGNINISDSTTNVTANAGTGGNISVGILVSDSDSITISGATVHANSARADFSRGINIFEGTMTITGSATVDARAENPGNSGTSMGIEVYNGNIIINSATVTAAATGSDSLGIHTDKLDLTNFTGTITMSGNISALEIEEFDAPTGGVSYSRSDYINGSSPNTGTSTNISNLPHGLWIRFTK